MPRRHLDQYFTQEWPTQALLAAYPQIRGGLLIDPCSGDGRMARALAPRFGRVLLNDIDPALPADLHLDACDDLVYADRPCWVVSNPPNYAAGEIIERALLSAPRCGVAMYLRATWGEPCGSSRLAPRGDRQWLADMPPTAVLFLPRSSFTGDGKTDLAPYYWYIWADESLGITNACLPRQAAEGPQAGVVHRAPRRVPRSKRAGESSGLMLPQPPGSAVLSLPFSSGVRDVQ